MKTTIAILILSASQLAGAAWAEQPSVQSLPASVVRTVPESGDVSVDAATTTQISVTFSKPMTNQSWSWVEAGKDILPPILGKPRYLTDKRTCVIDVKLEAKKTYALWTNSQKFTNFKDANGTPAVPYLLVFQTR